MTEKPTRKRLPKLKAPARKQATRTGASMKGWSVWNTSCMPDGDVYAVWGGRLRTLYHLQENSASVYRGDELVGEIRFRTRMHLVRVKRPPKGFIKPEPDYERILAEMRAWANARRAERGDPLLPEIPFPA